MIYDTQKLFLDHSREYVFYLLPLYVSNDGKKKRQVFVKTITRFSPF